ncbi:hypothetical protein BGZ60DRAFT_467158 [Tricladium varicosporioides]|nr:hypothetical protein BGZ60DRAFT_467158 [Hymenoscyphus varicosporioides]
MSSRPAGPIRKAWYRWKTAKWVPWRKRFLVGLDLQGNTFWEFKDTLSSKQHRMRRIVQYPSGTHHSDLKISPQWHQWLRHTRQDPPSLTEQSQDLVRQERLKILVAQADARWAAKPSVLDVPSYARGQPVPALGNAQTSQSMTGNAVKAVPEDIEVAKHMQQSNRTRHPFNEQTEERRPANTVGKEKEDPWKKVRGGPTEEWKPQSWEGNITPSRR